MPFAYVKSKKGRDKLAHDGFMYRLNRQNADGTRSWRCDQKPCKGYAKTDENDIELIREHTCQVNPARLEVASAVTEARQRAVDTHDTARRIVAGATEALSEEAKATFPKYETIQRQLARDRKRERVPYPVPRTIADIDIPQMLRLTKAGENFLVHDSTADDPERFLIFGTERNLETLRHNTCWCFDGTFKVCPEMFYQLWTIHGLVNNAVLPLVYVLMVRKTQELYDRVLDVLVDGRELAPTFIVSDFELAAMNSFRNHFENVQLHGCFCHLAQGLWRRVQALGLRDRYINDEQFRMRVKSIASLAFVRPGDVVETFDMLAALYEDEDDMMEILSYFEDNYVRGRGRERRRRPRFAIDVWNCHQATADGLPRTNNNVEGWHRAFQGMVGCQHPSVYRLIEALQLEQSLMETRRARAEAGEQVPLYSKKKYQNTDARLQRLIADYQNRDRIDFLRGCSYNFDL